MPRDGLRLRDRTTVAELDLHGKNVEQARRAATAFLRTQARLGRGRVVRIITGRGVNSPDAPKLPRAIERMLSVGMQEISEWDWSLDRGSVVIRLV